MRDEEFHDLAWYLGDAAQMLPAKHADKVREARDALTAERERAEKAERELHTVLARETATQARHDKRLDDLEAELARLRAVSDFNTHTNAPDPDGAVYRVMEQKLAEAGAERDEAVGVLLDFHDAAECDPTMEGPLFKGWSRSKLDRALTRATAFLAKLETKP